MKTTKHTKAPAETTVVVAMSGGVDSSVAAGLLVERGYNCIGIMMRLWAEVGVGEGSTNKCCSLESVHDARRVADALGIPFYLINVEQPFKEKVVDFFIDGYSRGITPNPCIECNRHIRFNYLLNYARRLGADYLATGHYARLRYADDGKVHLLKGVDEAKDQSYVLSVLGQDELHDVLFPVGEYPKSEVRRMAAERGLPTASKHDSMDLCFIFDDDYRRFLRTWAAEAMRPGPIVDRRGKVYGQHSGLPGYTIGQRKGLGISGAAEPLFVLELDYRNNALVVGTAAELGQDRLIAERVNWTLDEPPPAGARVQCKIRYKAKAVECTIFPIGQDCVEVQFDAPLRDITPGQGAVFYDGDLCLGGGVIARAEEPLKAAIKE
ncbi:MULTISPECIES: tRNA 2-thiouridine(34) synthase MnmA [Caldilinea]|uniref:tRNA-specific 2-thiouridylase MnmA n=1 Tax=Caldilinea aerophila (strain DSM 14535 / JCM 11387 / NBRC 104270 / STL-6-O1) TaxID=926550 RepID=I0I024_CALAS|nr:MULTISPECIES: tRNA 2-thiouridine(34) synthase MnmA [Caldilinea]BAL98611.1 tRNA-specific 2-thiouridylase MnmA [Caldilinea aerophila DSM 14535 = NBRC 104270]GIV74806.1 MAG: tRNA-specific 2-thiouridylase MnmA [Caldilinea sp.]